MGMVFGDAFEKIVWAVIVQGILGYFLTKHTDVSKQQPAVKSQLRIFFSFFSGAFCSVDEKNSVEMVEFVLDDSGVKLGEF